MSDERRAKRLSDEEIATAPVGRRSALGLLGAGAVGLALAAAITACAGAAPTAIPSIVLDTGDAAAAAAIARAVTATPTIRRAAVDAADRAHLQRDAGTTTAANLCVEVRFSSSWTDTSTAP